MHDYSKLKMLAVTYDDVQRLRIKMENRRRAYSGDALLDDAIAELVATEKSIAKSLVHALRRLAPKSIRDWQKEERGIGEHQLALLLGIIGDPVVAQRHWWEGTGEERVLVAGEPCRRTYGMLLAYCGHGPALKRKKGMTADEAMALGNPMAKKTVHLMAEAVIKSGNERYRAVYDDRRACTAQTHPEWSAGHSHNDALRIVGKWIIYDLWWEAGGSAFVDVDTEAA